MTRPGAVRPPYVMTPRARTALERGEPVVVDRVVLVDGRHAVRVRLAAEVLPASGNKGVRTVDTLRPVALSKPWRVLGWSAGIAGALAFLSALGWALVGVVADLLDHAVPVLAVVALVVLALGGLGGSCTVIVVNRRH